MDEHKSSHTYLIYTLFFILVIALAGGIYLWVQTNTQEERITMLLEERNHFLLENASTTNALLESRRTVEELSDMLSLTQEELDDIEDELRDERRRNEDFEDRIDEITGTVGQLDKLSKLDEELLQKYSKVYFLNENYYPERLRQIDQDYVLEGKKDQYFHADALPFLEDMLEDAEDDGIELRIVSAYRSFDEQVDVKGQHTQVYGTGANTFSADQGYSEHQLGTTVDLSDPATAGAYESFKDTEAYAWLVENAHKYGFVLSYPENNSFYIFEPWHWRFVGRDLARDLERKNQHFYDLEQRALDAYLISIFD